ncbi:MAG: ATP-binding protein [Planctomycetota bacterium]|nr:ATP-binding protein [Planctomycetota bacterium]
MLRKLSISGYKALDSFEIEFMPLTLLMGANGTGKTSICEVLRGIREFVIDSQPLSKVFSPESLGANLGSESIHIVIKIAPSPDLELVYELVANYERSEFVVHEELLSTTGNRLVMIRRGVQAERFNPLGVVGLESRWRLGRGFSALANAPDDHVEIESTIFRDWLRNLLVARPSPLAMHKFSSRGQIGLEYHLSNFVSWHRAHALNDTSLARAVEGDISAVFPEIRSLSHRYLNEVADIFEANVLARSGGPLAGNTFPVPFSSLSDGQRMLIALYTILHAAVKPGSTVIIDEPDNFVALREIQPWINALRDRIETVGGQAILISHHPEVLNQLATHHGIELVREPDGHIVAKRFNPPNPGALTPAELVARGHLDG